MRLKNSFLALSNILQAVEGGSPFGALELESQAILKFLAANEVVGLDICVTDITNNAAIPGAPATKLKRIHQLANKGWLSLEKSALHHRRISVRLTKQSHATLKQMSNQVESELRDYLV